MLMVKLMLALTQKSLPPAATVEMLRGETTSHVEPVHTRGRTGGREPSLRLAVLTNVILSHPHPKSRTQIPLAAGYGAACAAFGSVRSKSLYARVISSVHDDAR